MAVREFKLSHPWFTEEHIFHLESPRFITYSYPLIEQLQFEVNKFIIKNIDRIKRIKRKTFLLRLQRANGNTFSGGCGVIIKPNEFKINMGYYEFFAEYED